MRLQLISYWKSSAVFRLTFLIYICPFLVHGPIHEPLSLQTLLCRYDVILYEVGEISPKSLKLTNKINYFPKLTISLSTVLLLQTCLTLPAVCQSWLHVLEPLLKPWQRPLRMTILLHWGRPSRYLTQVSIYLYLFLLFLLAAFQPLHYAKK